MGARPPRCQHRRGLPSTPLREDTAAACTLRAIRIAAAPSVSSLAAFHSNSSHRRGITTPADLQRRAPPPPSPVAPTVLPCAHTLRVRPGTPTPPLPLTRARAATHTPSPAPTLGTPFCAARGGKGARAVDRRGGPKKGSVPRTLRTALRHRRTQRVRCLLALALRELLYSRVPMQARCRTRRCEPVFPAWERRRRHPSPGAPPHAPAGRQCRMPPLLSEHNKW